MTYRNHPMILTVGSLVGLTLGLLLGLATNQWQHPALLATASIFEPIGTMWINALRMIILPLVVSHLIVAIASMGSAKTTGKLGSLSVMTYLVLLAGGVTLSVLATPWLSSFVSIDPASLAALQANAPQAATDFAQRETSTPGFSDWIIGLIPANPIQAAANDQLLPVVICTVFFGMAIAQLGAKHRTVLVSFFEAVAAATLMLVEWILVLIPIGVFALALAETAKTGLAAIGMIGSYVLILSGLLIFYLLLIYPVTVLVGRVPLRRFAWAATLAQAVAVGTRSSLASLPPLLKGAKERLKLPDKVADFVLPLAVSAFKVNVGITSPCTFLFLAYIYGIDLEPGYIALYVVTISALSFSVPGIPSGSFFVTLPFYLDAGIPLEAVMLLRAVNAIPDIFMTVLNVTSDLSIATIVNRFSGLEALVPIPGSNGAHAAIEDVQLPKS